MTGEKIILNLKKSFKDDDYRTIECLKDKTGMFITVVSIFATFLVFCSKVVSYLIANVQYQYWNLDEGFLLEDNTAYLKLGVYTIYVMLAIAANVVAKKYIYLWELYDCIVYLYKKRFKHNKKRINESTKESKLIKELYNAILKADELNKNDESNPTKAEDLELVKAGIEKQEENLKILRHDYYDGRFRIIKWKIKLLGYLFVGFFVILVASFILQLSNGLSFNQETFFGIIKSMLWVALFIFAEIVIGAWFEVKLSFILDTKPFFNNEELLHNEELSDEIINILQERIITIQKSGIKTSFSDKACKSYIVYIISLAILALCFLPSVAKANLERMDTFYIVEDDDREYAVLENYGNKYILAECEIKDESISILTSNIYIVNEPIKMSKRKFEIVNKEMGDIEAVSQTEEK